MLKDLLPKYYFDQNYNCAETIIRAGNEYYNLGLHDKDMIILQAGKIAPWFGEKGGGIQYEFSEKISDLLEKGILRKVVD